MNREISQRGLRNDSAEVLRAVKDGECITVTSNGVPVAELVPLRRGRFVDAQAALEAFADAPSIDLQTLRDDLDVIGAASTFKKDISALPPFKILVGEQDEAFKAHEYEPLLRSFDNQGSVEVLDGLSHLDIIGSTVAHEKIHEFVTDLIAGRVQ